MKKDNFGDRMKDYEACGELVLPANIPIIIRLDGNSFSKLTKSEDFEKPFDESFRKAMESAMCEAFDYSGAKVGYSQSDEITLLVKNELNQKFLSNRVSKICSLVATAASNGFNRYFVEKEGRFIGAKFDCRVFVVPDREVNNTFLWRQKDAWKNAVYSYAFFELQKEKGWSRRKATSFLRGKNLSQKHEIIFQELNFNINDLATKFKRGFCVKRALVEVPVSELPEESQKYLEGKTHIQRNKVVVDLEIPLFNEDKDYIEQYIKEE